MLGLISSDASVCALFEVLRFNSYYIFLAVCVPVCYTTNVRATGIAGSQLVLPYLNTGHT